jgi:xylulose-5-phosphate/fructose-6-phosphate phosphoketolase
MEMLSEHTCEGWLEGYILTGRHGLLNSYEPFIHVIDSMVNQVCLPHLSSPDHPC